MYVKNAVVTRTASKVMNTSYGEKQVLTVTTEDNKEEKIWFKPGREPHSSLPQGARVQILYEPNNYGSVSKRLMTASGGSQQSTVSQAPQSNYQQVPTVVENKTTHEDISKYVGKHAELLSLCIDSVLDLIYDRVNAPADEVTVGEEEEMEVGSDALEYKKEFYKGLASEDIRSIAISLYITTQRKFNL